MNFIIFIVLILPVLLAVAYLTLTERKLLALLQIRRGPNVVFLFGLLQPIVDALKLITKESLLPRRADKYIYIIAPTLFLALALINWAFINFSAVYINVEYTALYILTISSLSVYGILLAGWSSGSVYGFLGAIRSAGQLISYELTFSLIIVILIIMTKNLNLYFITGFQKYISNILFILPMGLIFFISVLAELCRPPFDLPEAEAELVSGYNVDYSSLSFAFYFIGEYSNIILMSTFFVLLFWSTTENKFLLIFLLILIIKVIILNAIIVYIRGIVPRYRYDQLMKLQWMQILPFVLSCFTLLIIIIIWTYADVFAENSAIIFYFKSIVLFLWAIQYYFIITVIAITDFFFTLSLAPILIFTGPLLHPRIKYQSDGYSYIQVYEYQSDWYITYVKIIVCGH